MNFGYPDVVCDNMIDKSINNIDCVYVRDKQHSVNYSTQGEETELSAATIVTLVNNISSGADATITELEVEVCRAEVDSQILDSALNVYTAPFGKFFFAFINWEFCHDLTIKYNKYKIKVVRVLGHNNELAYWELRPDFA